MRRSILLAACAFIVGSALYFPSIGHGFVWDDKTLIEQNVYVRDASRLGAYLTSDFFRRSVDPALIGHWRPLVSASYVVDWRLGNGSPRTFHATNAVAHGLACALLVLLALALGLPQAAALGAALVFAAHPAHVEAVSWISGRTDLLCGLFVIAALLLDARDRPFASGVATFAALAAKEMAVVVPLAVALRAWMRPGGSARGAVRAALPHAVAIGLYALVRFGALGIFPRPPEAADAGRTALFLTWWTGFLDYARVLVWPWDLSIVARVGLETSAASGRVLAGAALFGAAVWGAWRARRRAPVASWALACLLASFLPLVNFVVPVRAIAAVAFPWAERFLFVPTIFAAIAFAALAIAGEGKRRTAGIVATALVVVALAGRTVARERAWASQRVLFAAAVAEAPGNAPARVNLGAALLDDGDAEGAEAEVRHALAIEPRDPIGLYILGNALRQRGDLAAAGRAYRDALAIRPEYPAAIVNLGLVQAAGGDLDAAEASFRDADRLLGGSPEAKVNLAIVMRMRGRRAEAIELYREALAIDPAFAPAAAGLAQLAP